MDLINELIEIIRLKGFNKDGQESFSYRTVYINTTTLHDNAQAIKKNNLIKTSKVKRNIFLNFITLFRF